MSVKTAGTYAFPGAHARSFVASGVQLGDVEMDRQVHQVLRLANDQAEPRFLQIRTPTRTKTRRPTNAEKECSKALSLISVKTPKSKNYV